MINVPPDVTEIYGKLLYEMEKSLSTLAAYWRGMHDTPAADEIAKQYQAILKCMLELGFQDSLDVDAELPERLMPEEYLALFNPDKRNLR